MQDDCWKKKRFFQTCLDMAMASEPVFVFICSANSHCAPVVCFGMSVSNLISQCFMCFSDSLLIQHQRVRQDFREREKKREREQAVLSHEISPAWVGLRLKRHHGKRGVPAVVPEVGRVSTPGLDPVWRCHGNADLASVWDELIWLPNARGLEARSWLVQWPNVHYWTHGYEQFFIHRELDAIKQLMK